MIFSITSSIETRASTISQLISRNFIPKARGLTLSPDSQVSPSWVMFWWIFLARASKSWSTSNPLTSRTTLDSWAASLLAFFLLYSARTLSFSWAFLSSSLSSPNRSNSSSSFLSHYFCSQVFLSSFLSHFFSSQALPDHKFLASAEKPWRFHHQENRFG